jgi:hypothetical protein
VSIAIVVTFHSTPFSRCHLFVMLAINEQLHGADSIKIHHLGFLGATSLYCLRSTNVLSFFYVYAYFNAIINRHRSVVRARRRNRRALTTLPTRHARMVARVSSAYFYLVLVYAIASFTCGFG